MDLEKVSKANRVNRLYNAVINGTTDDMEFKPVEEFKDNALSRQHSKNSLERINKQKMNVQMKENIIICDNILQKFFGLDDEKFYACLMKLNEWGFDITFKEFIFNYFFKIMKDNILKNYIMMNLTSILSTLKTQLELKLLTNMKNFTFATIQDDQEIEQIKNQILGMETSLLSVKSPAFNEFAPVDQDTKVKLDAGKKKDFRMEILNRLKYENPALLD